MALALGQQITLGAASGYHRAGKCPGLVSIVPNNPVCQESEGGMGTGNSQELLLLKPVEQDTC